jgi:hypothetical protein
MAGAGDVTANRIDASVDPNLAWPITLDSSDEACQDYAVFA